MRRIVVWLSLVTYCLVPGCSSVREVPVSESLDSNERVKAVVYPSGEVVEFNDEGGIINTYRGTIDGVTTDGKPVSIPITDTLHVRMNRTDTAKTVLWSVVGIGVVVALVAVLMDGAWGGDSLP